MLRSLCIASVAVWALLLCPAIVAAVSNTPTSFAGGACGVDVTVTNEGLKTCCYLDTKKLPTIGIGFNIAASGAAAVLKKYTGLRVSDVTADCHQKTKKHCITEKQARDIFMGTHYPNALACAKKYAGNVPDQILAGLADVAMAGCGTLHQFRKMQAAVKKSDWARAAAELKNSKWCSDVGPNRCGRDQKCFTSYKGGAAPKAATKPTKKPGKHTNKATTKPSSTKAPSKTAALKAGAKATKKPSTKPAAGKGAAKHPTKPSGKTATPAASGPLKSTPIKGCSNGLIQLTNPIWLHKKPVIHTGFSSSAQHMESCAASAKVKLYVTCSARVGTKVGGAIVPPATKSNHMVGHAIDINIQTSSGLCNGDCMSGGRNKEAKAFIDCVTKAGVTWGKSFSPSDPVHFDDRLNVHNKAQWDTVYKQVHPCIPASAC